jgi:selenocysteine lyase/cysteine desulfurase
LTGEGPRLDAAGDFGGFEGRAWLNCAHQGPLPRVAVAAATRALADKAPWREGDEVVLVDLAALGRVCRRAGVTSVVNGSQAVGAVPLDLAALPVDALVSCGFKWLCAPTGPGAAGSTPTLGPRSPTGRPTGWPTSPRTTSARTPATVWPAPGAGAARSALVVFGDHQPDRNRALHETLAAAGVDAAFRRGRLRVSPHLYNTEADVDRALEVLDGRTSPVDSGR